MLTAFVPLIFTADDPPSLLIPSLPDLFWGGLAFVVVLVAFIWKVVPRMNAAMDARTEAIAGGLRKAEEAQAGAQKALEEYNAQLAEARAEAGRIRDQAREDAKKIRAELVEQAQADAARIVANAQTQIEAERSSALTSLRTEVGSLALGLASTVIGESLNDDKRSAAIVDRFLADLETVDAAAAEARPSGARR
ncbi:MAG TPA: F0F1 ATP synthase subunit B [Pseudolysinimonas sp.]|jgi:F-type H+-transporting ATPase subunit b